MSNAPSIHCNNRICILDVLGALAGSLIIFVAFLAGGFSWLLVFIAFFVISSLLTRFRYEYKMPLRRKEAQGPGRTQLRPVLWQPLQLWQSFTFTKKFSQ
ncbi:MAG: DUF92 domain-containing protein [Nitrososphaerales archaeon]